MKQQPQRRRRRAPKREEVSTTHVRKGIFCLMILLGVVSFCAVAGMLVKLMLVDHDYYEAKAIRNQTRSTSVTASRGTIYDRNGNVLAASSSVENVFLDPLELSQNKVDVPALAKKLAAVLELDAGWIEEQAADTSLRYKVIKRRQAQEVCDKVREIIAEDKIIGVHLEPDSQRYYPYHDVAAQIIGFTNTENVGSEGLEAYYNDELQGTAGAVITTKGNYETQMLYSYEKYYQASDGDSIHLTLDTTVQYYLQKQMQDAVDRYDVLNGAFGIVMNCKTGEIVAMCTLGSYDPNDYQEIYDEDLRTQIEELYTKAEKQPENSTARTEAFNAYNAAVRDARLKQWRNRCVSDGYEPGSTFKILTLAAALDSGAVTTADTFYCGGSEKIEGREQILNCWNHAGHGSETTAQALQKSCNIAFAHIGLRTGGGTLYDYCRAFGLMEQTGIDLPGEASGVFHTRERLANTASYGTSYLIATSFGQTIKPTPIQLVTAISAVVNGGYLLEPYVVSEIVDSEGNVVQQNARTVVRQVISEETSATMRQIIESVVTEGTAKNGSVVGYRIGGKTGTADKGQTGDVVVSFLCFAPADDPQVIMLITMDTPSRATGTYVSGGNMVAPTASTVMAEILPYLGVEPSYSAEELLGMDTTVPNVIGMSVEEAKAKLKDRALSYKIVGDGETITDQTPAGGAIIPGKSSVILYVGEEKSTDKCVVPHLIGKTPSEANTTATAAGLLIRFSGTTGSESSSVRVLSQSIDEGTEVEAGTVITVQLGDTSVTD